MTYITEQVQELYPHNNARIAAQITKLIKRSELGTILEHAMDENFQEGLDRLAAETFDLVLMDCGMPTHSTSLRE